MTSYKPDIQEYDLDTSGLVRRRWNDEYVSMIVSSFMRRSNDMVVKSRNTNNEIYLSCHLYALACTSSFVCMKQGGDAVLNGCIPIKIDFDLKDNEFYVVNKNLPELKPLYGKFKNLKDILAL
jgi:hypothetical protein